MIVMLDNRDSFVFNLARYLQLLGPEVVVLPSDTTAPDAVAAARPAAVVISPGPCTPAEAGSSVACIERFRGQIPLLGVCLGHQAIVAACGGRIVRATEPRHGRTSEVFHDATNLFAGLPSPLRACRYHSLVADEASLPATLTVTGRTVDGVVMAVADERACLYGVQFHPESILTRYGFRLLANFLERAGYRIDRELVARLDDAVRVEAEVAAVIAPTQTDRVVTF